MVNGTQAITKKIRNDDEILGIKITGTQSAEVLRFVRTKLHKLDISRLRKPVFIITTPNPEQVLLAQNDTVYKTILNKSDISIPDGVGLVAASKFLKLPKSQGIVNKIFTYLLQGLGVGASIVLDRKWLTEDLKVIRGRDLFIDLISLANKKGWRVALVGDRNDSARKAKEKLALNYKSVVLEAFEGPNLDNDANSKTKIDSQIEKKCLDELNKFAPHLLFVGFGAPKQEKWLHKWWGNLKAGGAMVVGGTFDYISGKYRLPPKWIADIGMEWLWRLTIGHQTKERVFHAFPEFSLRIYLYKLFQD